MEKYLIGYKQGNNNYVFLSNITPQNIGVTTIMEQAIDFQNQDTAKNIKNFIKTIDVVNEYKVLIVTIDVKEVTE